jgi:hypothetical protein
LPHATTHYFCVVASPLGSLLLISLPAFICVLCYQLKRGSSMTDVSGQYEVGVIVDNKVVVKSKL